MRAEAVGAENVAAIELACGQKIERSSKESHPGGAPYGMEKQTGCFYSGMKKARKEMHDERGAEDNVGLGGIGDGGNNFRMKHSINERRHRENEADEGAGSADIKERARGTNGRTQQNERAESADQRGRRNEKGITRVNVMMAASEEVPQFMREKNEQQSEREGKTGGERSGMPVKKCEAVRKLVERNGLVFRISGGELGARGKASAKSQKKQSDCKEQRFKRRMRRDDGVIGGRARASLQVECRGNLGS